MICRQKSLPQQNTAYLAELCACGQPAAAAETWTILGTLFKYHAACHLTHSAMEKILRLLSRQSPSDLASLTLQVHSLLLDVCGTVQPKTGLECRFSLRGTASLILNGLDTAAQDTFVDEVLARPRVRQMMDRVQVETDDRLTQFQSRAVWKSSARNTDEAWCDLSAPSPDLQLQAEKLSRKFFSLCRGAGLPPETCMNKSAGLNPARRCSSRSQAGDSVQLACLRPPRKNS